MEQGPTEPHTGRSTFLLSSGGAGGAGITEWPLMRGRFLLRTSFPAGRQWQVWCVPEIDLRLWAPLMYFLFS